LGKRVQDSIEAQVIEATERYIEVESAFPKGLFCQVDLPTIEAHDEEAAVALRNTWHLGTDAIEDLCGRIERSIVRVIPLDGPRRLVYQALAEDLITPSHAARLLDETPAASLKPSAEQLQESAAELAGLYRADKQLTEFTDADWEGAPENGG